MKILLSALSLLASLQARATVAPNFVIQKFPGKVIIEADINITTPALNIDILFVVDDSGSMTNHQDNLSRASDAIDKALSQMNRDFHIGVISTSAYYNTSRGVLLGTPAIITPKDSPGALARNILVGTMGSPDEMPFDSVYYALSEPNLSGVNKGFLRPDASLALVFLTDAEDHSLGSTNDLKKILANTKGDLNNVTAYSWIIPTGMNVEPPCQRDDDRETPKKIEDLTNSLHGEIYNICDMSPKNIEDFTQKLAKFGMSNRVPIADLSEIPLTIQPVVSTIEVRFGTQRLTPGDLSEGWIYDIGKNAVILGPGVNWTQQPTGTKLVVSFVPVAWTK